MSMWAKTPLWIAVLAAGWTGGVCPADGLAVRSDRFEAVLEGGSLVGLKAAGQPELVKPPAEPRGAGIHRVATTHWARAEKGCAELAAPGEATRQYRDFAEWRAGLLEARYRIDAASGDLVVRQHARASEQGVWGVSWSIGDVPLDYAILVPGGSGLRLSAATPGARHQFDYPMSWESQFVVVEGPEGGFYVWAEDPAGRYKRLVVERRSTGWRLGFVTINDAPFDRLTECTSVVWRLNVYQGQWQTAARRYREWFEATCRPVRVEAQQPEWVRQIRACVIMGQDLAVLEGLARRLDPRQTLLYLPNWRAAGYDRNYPEYDRPVAQLAPFMHRARALGFRVMLHVNYFGVDPLHPLYEKFEPYQVRDPWGKHEKQWWVWPPEKPDIRFAYINPACKAWRDHFVTAMVQLVRLTGTDALHLDQTLCIFNDHNGRIEGQSMLEGSLALHRALRAALPQVALSGEGLNEITCRHEAFAQRHVWGLDHTKGRWDRRWLAAAHPISSFVLRPYTVIYGYLGCAPPESGQLYAAWNEAYRHWGVIPTLKPALPTLSQPSGFARQFFDEAAFWQSRALQIDLDGPWPAHAAFPYRTADGRPAAATLDRRLVCDDQEVSRTVTGATRAQGSGTIPGWRAYDERRLLGLDPHRWYPYFCEPRDPTAWHVCRLPERIAIGCVAELDDLALVETRDAKAIVADLAAMLDRAVCGSRPAKGTPIESLGPLDAADGAAFGAWGDTISAHPPWKVPGSGEAFARFSVALPSDGTLLFTSDVALAPGAVGPDKSDGVTFSVRATAGETTLGHQLHNATAEPRALALDLTALKGRTIDLELAVGPGDKHSPSFDWARWFRPRVEQCARGEGAIGVCGGKRWSLALGPGGPAPIRMDGNVQEVRVPLPGTVYFLDQPPAGVTLPLDLSRQPFRLLLVKDSGEAVASAQHAGVRRLASTVGGVTRDGLFAHPPDFGRAVALFPMTLPAAPARFEAWIGVRDGSTSDGVIFAVGVNGLPHASRKMKPGQWERLSVDLARWAGTSVVLALTTDSDGPFVCDWAAWGQPQVCH